MPLSRSGALILIYVLLFVPGALAWRASEDAITRWVHVTAPAAVDHLFSRRQSQPFERFAARLPLEPSMRAGLVRRVDQGVAYIEREARATLGDLIEAAQYAAWLLAAPLLAFFLLTGAPSFQRSALRVLPRGHMQWRAEEYLRDVNSALAGYIRAQTAGFVVLGVPSAVSIGVAAGILELVPAIGPLTALLIASAQAGDRLIAVLVFLGVLRVVQDYVIYPRLVRHGMHLSTPAVILTIWAGAVLAGAAGVILAIPVAGFLSVSLRHWREFREIETLLHRRPVE
jgi:predicted PurR-regulated permease PerM